MINHQLEWGTVEPKEAGFYFALKENHNKKLICVAVYVTKRGKEIGAHSFTGEEHCSYGSPALKPMSKDFLMWTKLPNPFK